MKAISFRVLTSAIFLALLLSIALPISTSAEAGTPPPPTEEPAAPPEEGGSEPAPVEDASAPSEEDASVEDASAPSEEDTPADEVAVTEEEVEPSEDTSVHDVDLTSSENVAEVLAELPEDTDLVVLDENGDTLSLASQAAADAVITGDPQWCPAGVTPGSGSCSPNFGSFDALIAWLEDPLNNAATSKAGVIWVAASYDSSTAAGCDVPPCDDDYIYFDGTNNLSHMASFSLTIKGGWTEVGTNIDAGDRSVFDGTALLIEGWVGDVTLSDILITGANSSIGFSALYIGTTGKVTLTRVDVDTNLESGAYIANAGGLAKDVVINNSTFSNNTGGNGLEVISHGAITLSNVIAENNGTDPNTEPGAGAILGNHSAFAKDVLVTNSTFSNNNSVGLGIGSSGKITLTNVIASDNEGSDGANLINSDGIKDVVVSNSTFSDNGGSGNGKGLNILTKGLITITNITAIGNTEWGAVLDNCDFDEGVDDQDPGDDFCGFSVVKNVTLLGTNIFADNVEGGLVVYSRGAITINNLISNSNDGWGAKLYNHVASTGQNVTLTKYSEFKFNGSGIDGGGGLEILSKGTVTLANITATNNTGGDGLFVDNSAGTGNVTITGTNTFSNNSGDGLVVFALGNIALNNVTAHSNGGSGAVIDNCIDDGGCTSLPSKTVKLTGKNTFTGSWVGDGLQIESFGAITISNLTASDNASSGALLNNRRDPAIQMNVTITGLSTYNNNFGGWGLLIDTYGAVLTGAVTAKDNANTGVQINNGDGNLARNVTMGNTVASGNGWSGLVLTSKGVVKFSSLQADGNTDVGANINNTGGIGSVTITGINSFSGNATNTGLLVESAGAITLYTFTADGNGGHGVYLDNSAAAAANISVLTKVSNWCNSTIGNQGSGFYALSNGIVTVSNLCSGNNNQYGVFIDNSSAATPKAVSISGSNSFEDNGWNGLHVRSRGAITLSNIAAMNNGHAAVFHNSESGIGIYLENYLTGVPTAPQNVTLTGYVEVTDSFSSGLVIDTFGAILINNLFATGNGWFEDFDLTFFGYGADLDNTHGSVVKPVTLKGTNELLVNYSGGLMINSLGALAINNLDASLNGDGGSLIGNGATLNNAANMAAPQNVIFTGFADFLGNGFTGLEVNTFGTITMAKMSTGENGGFGAQLDNSAGNLPRAVLLKGTNEFIDNGDTGLSVFSLGAITVSNLYAGGNVGTGVTLANNFVGAVGGITLTGINEFYDNAFGLAVNSFGAIKASNLTGSGNAAGAGAYLDNNFPEAVSGASITLTGTHLFENNGDNGLELHSMKVISLSNVMANGNGDNGVLIRNDWSGFATPADVKVTGTNSFSENGYSGLVVLTYGAATLNNLTAEDNGLQGAFSITDPLERGFGVLVDGCRADTFNDPNCNATISKGVTITGTNTFNGNAQTGLLVQALGLIKANALSAFQNQGAGVQLTNDYLQTLPAGATITGSNSFLDNDGQGLVVRSHRTITLANITANLNGDAGADLNTSCNPALPTCVANVLMIGTNTFNDNGDFGSGLGNGLNVSSVGSITINNLTANGNGDTGANLTNDSPSVGTPFIKLTGVNNFNQNKWNGLTFNSLGAVTITKLTADGNLLGDGVNGISDGAITITCGSMTNNGNFGLVLTSNFGIITLKGVFALGNGVDGTSLTANTVNIVRSC